MIWGERWAPVAGEVRYWYAMRIATWNVNGLRARMNLVAHWLQSRAPDVVGLQEVKVRDEDFPHEDFRALGYHAVVHGEKGWNGVAVLSRAPAEADTRGLPGREDDGARLQRVRVAGLHFATVYCPNGKTLDHPDFPLKLAWFDALRGYLTGVDRDSAFVIGGDFNIVPEALDCWQGDAADGSIFCTGEEREWSNNSIAALVRAVGLMSAWPVTGRTARLGGRTSQSGMSRALLKLSGSLVHDYATISDDSPSPNRASRARRAATSAGIS